MSGSEYVITIRTNDDGLSDRILATVPGDYMVYEKENKEGRGGFQQTVTRRPRPSTPAPKEGEVE